MDWKSLSVGEFAARYPAAIPHFKKNNVDFCCGGDKPLAEELERNNGLEDLLKIVIDETADKGALLDLSKSELVDFIIADFHEKHKRDFPDMIALAQKVENAHRDHAACPTGLAEFLKEMEQDLRSHMNKEETVLFPMIKTNPEARPVMPIKVMMAEHEEHKLTIQELEKVAGGFRPPEGACFTWQALCQALDNFVDELKEHIHIENNILFPKVLEEQQVEA